MKDFIPRVESTRAWLVPAATIGVAAFNWMAATGHVNGVTPAQVSDKYPTVITPAGYAFTIWSLIYLWLIAFSIYQLVPRNAPRFRPIRSLYILSCALNCAWIFFWNGDQIAISFAIIASLLAVLIMIAAKLRQTRSPLESFLVKGPLGLYLGWVAAAALVNFAVLLVYANIDLGDSAPAFGASLVLLAAAFGVFARVKFENYFAPVAVAWALTAIAVKQSGYTLIVSAAAVGVVACLIASLSFVLNLKSSSDE
jgi:benzodiazapine receptor